MRTMDSLAPFTHKSLLFILESSEKTYDLKKNGIQ